ncbi:LysR family transcriptional regulator [Aidingimonas halophila]|uniref:Transcriptional regulator, LysR family n=1 Tax=Aidingimonas halophila TaxID=574349 RepID=A0A1H2R3R8_9GAMM|nr:LysR family transcriptional regulator [Aidingimonas halophila]GHC19875.1 LysR family transcriptional regulator [Aidingimonas halophila]SDW14001.1 transcriptional regulator, LysR family [Aidingimonas halophila]
MTGEHKSPLPGQVSDFDIRLLRVFRAVAECGGFTAAEVVLGIGRPAISLHMNDLEKRLGLRLCQRGRGGFALTEEGRHVYEASLRLFASLEMFRSEVNELHHTLRGELNIGITDNLVSLPQMRITHTLADLKAQAPDVAINIHMDPPDAIAQGVLDSRLHLGVVPQVNLLASLETRFLYSECSRLYCANRHPLFDIPAEALETTDLHDYEAVVPGYPLPDTARAPHARLRGTATASDREGAAFLILTGSYIGYLPDHLAAPWKAMGRLRELPIDGGYYLTPFVVITRRDRRPNRVLEAFFEVLEKNP